MNPKKSKPIPLVKQLRDNQVIGYWTTKTKDLDAREKLHGGKRKGAGRKPSGRRPYLLRLKPATMRALKSRAKPKSVCDWLDGIYAP